MKKKSYSTTNMTKLCTLMLLSDGPKHGYEIMDQLELKLNKRPSPGQIYPLLSKLTKNGILTCKTVGSGRKRKVYSMTAKGRKTYKRLFHRLDGILSVLLEPKLFACAHCACKVYEGGHKEKIGGEQLTFCCSHCAHSYKMELKATK